MIQSLCPSQAVPCLSPGKKPVFSGKSKQKEQPEDTFVSSHSKNGGHISKAGLMLSLLGLTGAASASVLPAHDKDVSTREVSHQDALRLLECMPWAPTDHSLFTPQVYSDTPAMAPAAEMPWTDAGILAQLNKTLTHRFGDDQTALKEALDEFNDAQLKELIPDARLRASVSSLKGTPGEKTLDLIKGGAYRSIRFEELASGIVAATKPDPEGKKKPELLFNKRYQHEDFRLLTPSFVHDPLHSSDNIASGREERISHALDTLMYGKLIQEDPELAASGTELARKENTKYLARLNSRDSSGNLRLFTAQGNVYPEGKSLSNFAAAFTSTAADTPNATIADSSPGNELLKNFLSTMAGADTTNPNFDDATEKLVDAKQTVLTPEELVESAKALKLNLNCLPPDIAAPTKPTDKPGETGQPSNAMRKKAPAVVPLLVSAGLLGAML